jgi:hypothetical protein
MKEIEKKEKKRDWQETAIIVAGSFLIVFMGGKMIKGFILDKKKDSEIEKYDDVSAYSTAFAAALYSAFFRSGQEWLSDLLGDGTDTAAVYDVAKKMYNTKTSFADVSKSYKKLYNRTLLQDLQKELSSSEMQKFEGLLKMGLGNVTLIRV